MKREPHGVLVIVERQEQLLPLLSGAYQLATARDDPVVLLVVDEAGTEPAWLDIPAAYDQARIEVEVCTPSGMSDHASRILRSRPPALVVLGMEEDAEGLVNEALIPLVERVTCPLAVVRGSSELKSGPGPSRFLVPFRDDANSRFALHTALSLDPEAAIVAVQVVPEPVDDTDRLSQEQELAEALSAWAHEKRITPKLLIGSDTADLLVAEAAECDTIVIGVSKGRLISRAVTGDEGTLMLDAVQRAFIQTTTKRVVVLQAHQGWFGALLARLFTRGDRFMPTLTQRERIAVYREIRRSARPTQDFFVMIGCSAAIASMGLILNSPAIIIGAMLIAPLMSAIVGMGLAIVQGDFKFFMLAAKASFRGVWLALLVGLVISILDLSTAPNSEMFARSEPRLLDFLVATVSGFAAAYALCRRNLSAALPGVAIAVALVPPLATAGLFAGLGMLKGVYGALLLFLTNLAAITLASALVFTFLGFQPRLARERDTRRFELFQRGLLVAALVALAVFSHLTVLSVGEWVESQEESEVQTLLTRYAAGLGEEARLVSWSSEETDGKFWVTASIASPRRESSVDMQEAVDALESELQQPVHLELIWLPADTAVSGRWAD